MRELTLQKRTRRYKEPIPIKKIYIIIGYVFLAVLLGITILTKSKILLFLFATFFSSVINYQTNLPTIRFNPDPEVFFGLVIARLIGFPFSLIMLFIPTLLVDLYTRRFDKDTFISYFLTATACFLMARFPFEFVPFGIVLVTVRFLIGLGLNVLLDVAPHEIVFEHLLGFVNNILIFLAFGQYVIMIFS